MLEAARNTWHELDMMTDVTTTFYGDGLVQAMAKTYVRKGSAKGTTFIGFNKPELISAEYRHLNAKLHADNLAYGVGGGRTLTRSRSWPPALKTRSILDYGCGKGYLGKALPRHPIWEFDPAIPGKSESPRPADLVVCTDVLEHIEPDRLAFVLDDLRRCVKQIGYFVICTVPSSKFLADGRNSHLIQRDRLWWKKKLQKFFTIGKIIEKGPLLYVVVAPKKQEKAAA
jgi:2-polyprenyl-3-methyl-5-hydroxy-6-metoxy-1,4-benzoquinol methylase